MWLATVSATATFVVTLSGIATVGSFLAYLYFGQRSNANAAREEALALAETRREVIEDLRNRLASSDERHRRLNATCEKRVRKLEKALENPAYNFVIHTGPVQENAMAHYHWHIEIIPRLVKVAGFEWGTGFYINPTPPEESAQFLRNAGI